MTRRAEIAGRVDELARQHSGREFADAIRAYSATLDDEAQEELKQVLLSGRPTSTRRSSNGWTRAARSAGSRTARRLTRTAMSFRAPGSLCPSSRTATSLCGRSVG